MTDERGAIGSPLAGEESEIDLALARSVLYEALALGFARPTAHSIFRLTSGGARGALSAAALLLQAADRGGPQLAAAVRDAARLAEAPLAQLVARHERVFGHTAHGAVCPFETEYGADGLFQQPQRLADIAGYYLAFGLRPKEGIEQRVDHIGSECEFVGFLCRKEALLLARSLEADAADADTLAVVRRAARTFLRDHLGRFAAAMAARLAAEDPDGFYGTLGELLRRFVGRESAAAGVAPGPPTLALRSTAPDAVPIACGSGDELIQIQGLRGRSGD